MMRTSHLIALAGSSHLCFWLAAGCGGPPKPVCGNGELEAGEQCDDGAKNSDAPDATCRKDCSVPRCGDGITDPSLGRCATTATS